MDAVDDLLEADKPQDFSKELLEIIRNTSVPNPNPAPLPYMGCFYPVIKRVNWLIHSFNHWMTRRDEGDTSLGLDGHARRWLFARRSNDRKNHRLLRHERRRRGRQRFVLHSVISWFINSFIQSFGRYLERIIDYLNIKANGEADKGHFFTPLFLS